MLIKMQHRNFSYERQFLDGSLRCVDSDAVSYSCALLGPDSWAEITSSTAPGECGTTVFRRVERFGCLATVSFASLHIRIRSKFYQNSGKMLAIPQRF